MATEDPVVEWFEKHNLVPDPDDYAVDIQFTNFDIQTFAFRWFGEPLDEFEVNDALRRINNLGIKDQVFRCIKDSRRR